MKGILLTHPDIVDADVIGIKTGERAFEAPRAYIVRRPGSEVMKLEEAVVKAHVELSLASYRRSAGGARFVENVVKNAPGNVNTGGISTGGQTLDEHTQERFETTVFKEPQFYILGPYLDQVATLLANLLENSRLHAK